MPAKVSSPATDYDSPWKEVITNFFESFIVYFFPDIHAAIDWQQPVEFLDKELRQLAVEAEVGRRLADTLVKVWLRNGAEVRNPPIISVYRLAYGVAKGIGAHFSARHTCLRRGAKNEIRDKY